MRSLIKKLPVLLILLPWPVIADTCKYEDEIGRVIYSNKAVQGAKKISCFNFEKDASNNNSPYTSNVQPTRKTVKTPTQTNFPRVNSNTQKDRDEKRRKILQEELVAEQKALELAKSNYQEGENNPEVYRTANGRTMRNVAKYEAKMRRLQDAVDLHNKNIKLLQQELNNMK